MDIGDILSLEPYNRNRWAKNALMGGAVDGLEKVFGLHGTMSGAARGLGLKVFGALGPGVKEWIMKRAEG